MGTSDFKGRNLDNLVFSSLGVSIVVDKIWQGGKVLPSDQFTPGNLTAQRRLVPYGIVHLATHAQFKPGALSNARIFFGKNSEVSLDQVQQLELNNPPTNLLVLNACETAIPDEQVELGFAGLAAKAGVTSVLASLWSVDDAGSFALTTKFYEQLREAPIKAEALRQAQIGMLKGGVNIENGQLFGLKQPIPLDVPNESKTGVPTDFRHPYYWAGFTMIGNPW